MKKLSLLMVLCFLLFSLSGCATLMTGMTSQSYRAATVVITYPDEEVVRDQSQVATLVVPMATYGLTVDGVRVKELEGGFNPDLRVWRTANDGAYIVDLMPGRHDLVVTYDGVMQGSSAQPAIGRGAKVGSATISASYSGPPPISWIRTSETSHELKGGEIYYIAPKLMTITGEIDLYELDEADRPIIIESRNMAQF